MNIEQRVPVLVAEDAEDNRFLLQAYCRGTVYELTFAEDGEKAVQAYQAGGFQIVIMDVQMPVMDGLSATRLIRTMESDRSAKRTPILALTANVMPQDVVLAHAAGCDVHLGKPISKQCFLNALEQWTPSKSPIRIEIQPGLEQLAQRYLVARQEELPLLQGMLRRSAFEEVKRLAHNLKGTGTSYGFPEITRLGAVMENSASRENLNDLSCQIGELTSYLEEASEQVRKIC